MSTKTYFYPTTAEVLVDLGYPVPAYPGLPIPPSAPNNTMGGFGNGFDIHDYNGDRGGANIFQPLNPADPVPSVNVKDTLNPFNPTIDAFFIGTSWYLMRRTVFKNWTLAGIFTRSMDYVIEADLDCVYTNGGFRDEAPNSALAGNFWGDTPPDHQFSPYGPASPQGCGVGIKVAVGGLSKGLYKIEGASAPTTPGVLSQARSTISIPLANLSPADLLNLEVHVITEQFCNAADNPTRVIYPHTKVETQLYRLGLAADPLAMRSSGKASAALTSR